jgi:hypothetical protein
MAAGDFQPEQNMTKLTAPLLSLKASGKFGNDTVYSSWNGRAYAKQLAVPTNPKTPAQKATRLMFGFLADAWLYLPPAAQATWQQPADQRRITPANAFMAYNMHRWSNFELPQQQFHQPITTTQLSLEIPLAYGGHNRAYYQASRATNSNLWGIILFRDTDLAAEPQRNTCVAIALPGPTPFIVHDEPNIAPGTYYLFAWAFNIDGVRTLTTERSNPFTVA